MTKNETIQAQIVLKGAYITLWQTKILSGGYKLRKLYHGFGTDTPFTDEEKLQDALDTLDRHVTDLFRLTNELE